MSATDEQLVKDHTLMAKGIGPALEAIATTGEDTYHYKTDVEEYSVICPPTRAKEYVETGGEQSLPARVKDTCDTLIRERKADFNSKGIAYITVNKVLKEISRTKEGTKETRSQRTYNQVLQALKALVSMRVEGYGPEGDRYSLAVLDAPAYFEALTYKGNTYRDVFAFNSPKSPSETLMKAAEARRQVGKYQLTDGKPQSITEAEAEAHIREIMHEARVRLYILKHDKLPAPIKKRTSWEITRSWDQIFRKYQPIDGKPLQYSQKQKIVRTYAEALRKVADLERQGKVIKGAPLYVKAHSTYEAGRGRGQGAYKNLELEIHRDTVRPVIDIERTPSKPKKKQAKKSSKRKSR